MIEARSQPKEIRSVRRLLRIAYCIINHNKREGTSKAIAEVAERLATRHKVHVFSRSAEGVDLENVCWHRIRGPRYPHVAEFLSYAWSSPWHLNPENFDIVHAAGSVFSKADVYSIQNIQPAKRKVLATFAQKERAGLARRWARGAYLRVTCRWEQRCYERPKSKTPLFLPVSKGVERELREFYAIGDSHVQIIPNAADIETFRPISPPEKQQVRASFGVGETDFVCAFSGGEWRRKGLDLAIAALGQVSDPTVKLLVLGHDPGAAQFHKLSREHGVADRVIFAGFQSHVERGLACSDLFLFPSRYEAFSLATLEAAACGLPIVATRINGTEEFIEPGVNGEFVASDPEQIATFLRSLASNLATCRRMGEAARHSVERHYTWERVAKLTEDAYYDHLAAR